MKIKKHSIDDIWPVYWAIVAVMAAVAVGAYYAEQYGYLSW